MWSSGSIPRRRLILSALATVAALIILSQALEYFGYRPKRAVEVPEPSKERTVKATDGGLTVFGEAQSAISGDAIRLTSGRVVRYLGIDAPLPGQRKFGESRALNERLVLGRTVELRVCAERPKDDRERTLARVLVDGVSVEEQILAQGLATPYPDRLCDFDRRARLFSMTKAAVLQGLGLWSEGERGPIAAAQARDRVGEFLPVRCSVDEVRRTSKTILLLCGTDFRVVIFTRDRKNFTSAGVRPENDYPGKKLVAWGRIKKYEGAFEIIASGPEQLEAAP